MENTVGISLNQEVAATAGRIFAFSGLERIDIFKTSATGRSSTYLNTPIVIGFEQPLFGFNQLKWDKEIEPLRYEEASRENTEELETVAFEATNLFFEVLIAPNFNADALELLQTKKNRIILKQKNNDFPAKQFKTHLN